MCNHQCSIGYLALLPSEALTNNTDQSCAVSQWFLAMHMLQETLLW